MQTENIKSTKPLPANRSTDQFMLGYKESERVPPGKVSLLQAISFITKHQSSPEEWTIEKIAEENKIKPDVASKQFWISIASLRHSSISICSGILKTLTWYHAIFFSEQVTSWNIFERSTFICRRIWIRKKLTRLSPIWNCLVQKVQMIKKEL